MRKKNKSSTAKKKNPTKKLRKEIKTLKKTIKKTANKTKIKEKSMRKDLERLKTQIQKLSKTKKKTKRQLSEYNLFMRRHLLKGVSFNRATKLWKAYLKGKPIIKTRVKTIIKTKKIKQKPKVITKTIIKKVPTKPKIVTKTIVKEVPVTTTNFLATTKDSIHNLSHVNVSKEVKEVSLSDEELALRLLSLYFEEVARLGLKRQLQMKDVLDSYYEILEKIKKKKIESNEFKDPSNVSIESDTQH